MNSRSVLFAVLLVAATVVSAQPRRPATQGVAPEVEALLQRLPKVEACALAGTLTCGMDATGTTGACNDSPRSVDRWEFFGTAGETITVTVTNASSSFDLLLAVGDPDTGAVYGGRTARGTVVVTVTLPVTKRYVITVAYAADFFTHPYAINLACGTTPSPGECYPSGKLLRGQLHKGQLAVTNGCNTEGYHWTGFRFDGTEGVPVRITSDATFPIYIETSSYSQSEPLYVSTLTLAQQKGVVTYVFYPDRTGLQELWVSHNSPKVTGSFTLLLEDAPLEPCRRRAARH